MCIRDSPKTGGNEHLQILAMLSQMLMDTDFKDSLINAQSVEEFMDLINQKEAAQKAKEDVYKRQTFNWGTCLWDYLRRYQNRYFSLSLIHI